MSSSGQPPPKRLICCEGTYSQQSRATPSLLVELEVLPGHRDQFPGIPYSEKPKGPNTAKECRDKPDLLGFTRGRQVNRKGSSSPARLSLAGTLEPQIQILDCRTFEWNPENCYRTFLAMLSLDDVQGHRKRASHKVD